MNKNKNTKTKTMVKNIETGGTKATPGAVSNTNKVKATKRKPSAKETVWVKVDATLCFGDLETYVTSDACEALHGITLGFPNLNPVPYSWAKAETDWPWAGLMHVPMSLYFQLTKAVAKGLSKKKWEKRIFNLIRKERSTKGTTTADNVLRWALKSVCVDAFVTASKPRKGWKECEHCCSAKLILREKRFGIG